MGERVTLTDVSLRDGLQSAAVSLTTAEKQQLLAGLVAAGIRSLELTSFVSLKAVPAMADADELMQYARQHYPAVTSLGLIFNRKGYERARAAGCEAVSLVVIVPPELSKANSGRSADDWLTEYSELLPAMRADGVWVRGYLAGAWVSPFDGPTDPQAVLRYAEALLSLGVDELCPTDVVGQANPDEVGALCARLAALAGADKLALHLHDTQALGLANAYAALQAGVRVFDTSLGGLGGCPFAPGSAGNLASEDLVLLLHKLGYETGVDLAALWALVEQFRPMLGAQLGGRSGAWFASQKAVQE